MKKFLSSVTAVILTTASAMPLFSNAEDYIPLFYMKPEANEDAVIEEDGTIVISRESAAKGITLKAGVYIQDETDLVWNAAPKWKCASYAISLEKAYNPIPEDDSPLLPYAYAETDSQGNIVRGSNTSDLFLDRKNNVISYTCRHATTNGTTFKKYGATSDEYPLITFDMVIDKNVPYGEYDVYFLTKPEDYEDQQISSVALKINGSTIYTPRTEGLKIRVEGSNLGDINNDGLIDSSDASEALIEYARIMTNLGTGLDALQAEAADVNFDGAIDSSDAADILSYYAYTRTSSGEIKGLREYFGR